MNVEEWKLKQIKQPASKYTHFDRRLSLESCFDYIFSPDRVARHGFYPFIHYTIKSKKVKNGKKGKSKERQIYYAAHLDGWIYRYYAYLINEAYNYRVKIDNIDAVAVAYRTDIGKGNIQFAKEAFAYIRKTKDCYVMVGDFTNFFDNLNHAYLKNQLCDLLSVSRLSNDFYAVYKNVTQFSYIELQELLALNGLEDTLKGRKEFNARTRERALSPEELRKNRELIKPNPNIDRGVPQGSPISAVLANVYMLSVDKQIQEYVSSSGGFYMRYSDDFIVILPNRNVDFSCQYKHIKELLGNVPNLIFEDSKTKVFYFESSSVINCTSQFILNGVDGKNLIEFLGFSFDGKSVRIRDKTISKYYNRLYRKTKTIVKHGGYTPNNKKISAKNLYQKYSFKGSRNYLKKLADREGASYDAGKFSGNFLDYVARAKAEFCGDLIEEISGRHMQKIQKRLKNGKSRIHK